ncbi:hypothetical protein [Actinoplanes sp. HUAS TT8]|uniref:hypothetical protein n=1 Tax=Actinoplanes sp. HUAS TT8 TaxID=3447453 RepID=UPI003F51B7D4
MISPDAPDHNGIGTRVMALLAAGAALVGTGACSRPTPLPTPKYTHQQAVEMVDGIIATTAEQLKPQPQVEINGGGDSPCTGWRDEEGSGQVMYERSVWLNGLIAANNDRVLQTLIAYWNTNQYKTVRNDSSLPNSSWTVVVSDPNDFSVKFVKSVEGRLSLHVQSPCVYKEIATTRTTN